MVLPKVKFSVTQPPGEKPALRGPCVAKAQWQVAAGPGRSR